MRRHIPRFGMAIVLLALLLGIASGVSIPNKFYGDAMIGDSKAPDGTKITAEINGVEYAKTTSSNGQYYFNVPSDDPATPQKEGGVDGDTVVFYVNVVRAGNHSFKTGDIIEVKLFIAPGTTPEPRVVKTPEASGAVSSGIPPAAPPQVTPTATPVTVQTTAPVETTLTPGAASENHAKGEQGRSTTYVILIIAVAIIILIVYFMRIRKIE